MTTPFLNGASALRRSAQKLTRAGVCLLGILASGLQTWAAEEASPANARPIDTDVIDQDGHTLRFPRDVIGERITVVNFIYTSCKTLCPVSSAIMSGLEKLLVERGESDVRIVSISIDPETDTPIRLKAFAGQFQTGNNWLWITGEAASIEAIARSFDASFTNFRAHGTLTLVGDAKYGHWMRFNTLVGPERLLAEIKQLETARVNEAKGH